MTGDGIEDTSASICRVQRLAASQFERMVRAWHWCRDRERSRQPLASKCCSFPGTFSWNTNLFL